MMLMIPVLSGREGGSPARILLTLALAIAAIMAIVLMARIIVHMVKEFGIEMARIHNDSTSITFCGEYPDQGPRYVRPRHFPWAELLRRTFEIDILACPDCGNRLRLLATIENRAVIERILAHLGLPIDMPTPAPARSTEWLPGVLSGPETNAGSEWFE